MKYAEIRLRKTVFLLPKYIFFLVSSPALLNAIADPQTIGINK
jgi:hypothetical protein